MDEVKLKLLGEKGFDMITGIMLVFVLALLYLVMRPKTEGLARDHFDNLPSPALGLGTSNVMGFYQGFDQLWGPGSSSYSAPDDAYLQVMHEFDPSDPAFADMPQ
jgi:hypothetical protein